MCNAVPGTSAHASTGTGAGACGRCTCTCGGAKAATVPTFREDAGGGLVRDVGSREAGAVDAVLVLVAAHHLHVLGSVFQRQLPRHFALQVRHNSPTQPRR